MGVCYVITEITPEYTWLLLVLQHGSDSYLVKHIATFMLLTAHSRLRVALFNTCIGERLHSNSVQVFVSNSPNDQYSLHYITYVLPVTVKYCLTITLNQEKVRQGEMVEEARAAKED